MKWLSFIGVATVLAFIAIVVLIPKEAVHQQELVSPRTPVRLRIPTMNVDASIESLGLASDGTMAVPKGPDNVAWYSLGTRPGNVGSAVIAGHSGWKDDIPAVFDNLNQLKKGDKIYVTDEHGTITNFVVSGTKTYDPNADASLVFNSSDGKSHLNLITCSGAWDSFSQSSSKRLVIFADKALP